MTRSDWVSQLLEELAPPAVSEEPAWQDVLARAELLAASSATNGHASGAVPIAGFRPRSGLLRRAHRPFSRRGLALVGRGRRRRVRFVLALAVLFLLLTGVATATYLLAGGNGGIAVVGDYGTLWAVNPNDPGLLLAVNPNDPGLRTIAHCGEETPSCAVFQPAWSPDGKQIAFVRGRYEFVNGGRDRLDLALYVAPAGGGDSKQLSACGMCGQMLGATLAWSPDGGRIAFSRDDGARGEEALWIVAPTGGTPQRVTDCRPGCADVGARWSPDGRLLVFAHLANDSTRGLYTVRADGSGLTQITEGGSNPQWSPNGRRIAFDDDGGVAVTNADGSDIRLLFAEERGEGPGIPSWSPDGSKLAFFRTPGRPGSFRAEVWTINADGSDAKRLYGSDCCVDSWAGPIWSPDGRVIAFAADSGGGTFVIGADGTGLRWISPNSPTSLSWQHLDQR
jgi:WD40 repeat protein